MRIDMCSGKYVCSGQANNSISLVFVCLFLVCISCVCILHEAFSNDACKPVYLIGTAGLMQALFIHGHPSLKSGALAN